MFTKKFHQNHKHWRYCVDEKRTCKKITKHRQTLKCRDRYICTHMFGNALLPKMTTHTDWRTFRQMAKYTSTQKMSDIQQYMISMLAKMFNDYNDHNQISQKNSYYLHICNEYVDNLTQNFIKDRVNLKKNYNKTNTTGSRCNQDWWRESFTTSWDCKANGCLMRTDETCCCTSSSTSGKRLGQNTAKIQLLWSYIMNCWCCNNQPIDNAIDWSYHSIHQ